MSRIDNLIDGDGNSRFISTLDLTRGYWQMPMAKKDRHKTAFTTPYGQFQFQFQRLPIGLSEAPSSFQRLMDKLINGHQAESCSFRVYLLAHKFVIQIDHRSCEWLEFGSAAI